MSGQDARQGQGPVHPTPSEAPLPAVAKGPLVTKWNLIPCILVFIFILAAPYYIYVRVCTLTSTDAIVILALEVLGMTTFVPYAIFLTRGMFPTSSPGLPAWEDVPFPSSASATSATAQLRFSVRVLIPCYKEPLDIVTATVVAALNAKLPASCSRTVYLLDDGGAADKEAFVSGLGSPAVHYITGRERKPSQANGKSENLNNALRSHIYGAFPRTEAGETAWESLPDNELIVVLDADMRVKPDFFLKTLEVMCDDSTQMVLTPQAFHSMQPDADLFNHINLQFWEYWLPGAFAFGYIACTGTNYVIRARALASCGWFPNTAITEDYLLGMELRRRGHRASYLMQYLAEGEAPEDVREIFQQRSRWNKGHFQVFFSKGNPLFVGGLPFLQRLCYAYAAWAPFCNALITPAFILIPFLSIVFNIYPVVISFQYVLAATVYFLSTLSIQYYARTLSHFKSMWFASTCNVLMFFTHWKSMQNSLAAAVGAKQGLAFKVTRKDKVVVKVVSAPPASSTVGSEATLSSASALPLPRNLSVKTQTTNGALGHGCDDCLTPSYAAANGTTAAGGGTATPRMRTANTLRQHAATTPRAAATPRAVVVTVVPTPRSEASSRASRGRCTLTSCLSSLRPRNVSSTGAKFDILVMLTLFLLSLGTGCFGIWRMVHAPGGADSTDGARFSMIATLWAFNNTIAPLLFLWYCATSGATLRFAVKWLAFLSTGIILSCVGLMWMLVRIVDEAPS